MRIRKQGGGEEVHHKRHTWENSDSLLHDQARP